MYETYQQNGFLHSYFSCTIMIQGSLNLNDKDVKAMDRRILLDDLIDQTSETRHQCVCEIS